MVKRLLRWFSQKIVYIVLAVLIILTIRLTYFTSLSFSLENNRSIIEIAAISALLSAITAIATLIQAIEVQKQRKDFERPNVLVYFDDFSSGLIYLTIENCGNSPALNVKIQFDPSPTDYSNRPISDISLFSNRIKFLPQGKIIRQTLDVGNRFLQEGKPTKFSVKVNYSSPFGDSFEENFNHDLEYLKQTTLPRKTIEDYLKIISEKMK